MFSSARYLVHICVVLNSLAYIDSFLTRILTSDACYLDGECGLHWLSCPTNQRLALSAAAHGFKPRTDTCSERGPGVDCLSLNTTTCCTEEPNQDCVLSYREHHLQRIFEKCSGKSMCKVPPISVTDACYSMSSSEPASFSSISYGCIPDSVVGQYCQHDVITGSSVSAVFKPNGLNMLYDKTCFCRIESAAAPSVVDVQVYAVDVRFKRSTSNTCSELSIIKGVQTHGTIATPTLPGEGFIHSFLPIINLTTPILTRLLLSKYALPDSVWLHFQSTSGQLRLKCGQEKERAWPSCMKGLRSDVPQAKEDAPALQPNENSPDVVDVMIGVMEILFYEKTPVIGAGIAGAVTIFTSVIFGIYMYKRRHIKNIKSVKTPVKMSTSPKHLIRRGLRRLAPSSIGLRGRQEEGKETKDDSASETSSSAGSLRRAKRHKISHSDQLLSEVKGIHRDISDDANIIIVSRPSRDASVRSSCTCSTREQSVLPLPRPPDVVLDSRTALQSAVHEQVLPANTCCSHSSKPCHSDSSPADSNVCIHGRQSQEQACCHLTHQTEVRKKRLDSLASQVSVGTQIYASIPEVTILPTRKRKHVALISGCIGENSPMYIVHNSKKLKDISPRTNRIWNWLKSCKVSLPKITLPSIRRNPEVPDQPRFDVKDDVIQTRVVSHSALPLPRPPTPPPQELKPVLTRNSSVPSVSPPKPPPRLPTRPARSSSLQIALKTMNDVYTQVVTLPPKRVKPRVPRRRTQDCGTQVYQDVTQVSTSTSTTPAQNDVTASTKNAVSRTSSAKNETIHPIPTISCHIPPTQTTHQRPIITPQSPIATSKQTTTSVPQPSTSASPAVLNISHGESDSSVYANDYIMPIHSRGYVYRRSQISGSYDEVSVDDDSGGISFLHTVTLGSSEQEVEPASHFDRIKSIIWRSLMRFVRK